MEVVVKKISREEANEKGMMEWPVWEKEESLFEWKYDEKEEFWVIEGKAEVTYGDEVVEFGVGDNVVMPAGLECMWKIIEPIKKHYRLG